MTIAPPGGTEQGLRRLVTGARSRRIIAVPRPLRRLSGPIALFVLWWLLTSSRQVTPSSFPRIGEVLDTGVSMVRSGELQSAIWASGRRVLIGLSIGVSCGLLVAIAAGITRRGEDLIDSTMQVFKAIPSFSLVPLLIIWLGIYEGPKIVLIALSAAMPIYINTYGGIRNVDDRLVEAGRTLGLNRLALIRHIVVPGALPSFLTGLRFSFANVWLALVVAEQINANSGLGLLLADGRSSFRLDIIVLVVVIYAMLGLLSYAFVRLLERRLLQWRRGFEGE
ncbi:unannotated protein [freshwater metagenome]|uniref:Unannotated protein n=1 Tax=freshwater metagenome TaxID=449393 RepID=A0A6J7FVE8_9ZZZZ|nr:ABC transporter permease subunit [Actinomycetota bacterium]